jgi:hypothetical protein
MELILMFAERLVGTLAPNNKPGCKDFGSQFEILGDIHASRLLVFLGGADWISEFTAYQ